jgi:hypothetical protein
LVDVVHGFDPVSAGDIMTWTLTFLDAQVRGLPAARAQLATMTSVSGGVEDEIVIGPTPP